MQCKPQDLHAERFILDITPRIFNGDYIQFYIKIRASVNIPAFPIIFGRFPSFPLETSLNWLAVLSLLLPSCQTEKTNNWEVVDSLSQSAIFPPLVAFHQDLQWKNMQQFNSYSPIENFILNLYFAESLLYSSVVFSSVFFANTTNQLERYILPFLL